MKILRFSLNCLLLMQLVSCAAIFNTKTEEPVNNSNTLIAEELKSLLRQKKIDPLTRYIEKYQRDVERGLNVQKLMAEREKRCQAVKKTYASRPKTAETAARLKEDYLYSCPAIVQEFLEKIPSNQSPNSVKSEIKPPVKLDKLPSDEVATPALLEPVPPLPAPPTPELVPNTTPPLMPNVAMPITSDSTVTTEIIEPKIIHESIQVDDMNKCELLYKVRNYAEAVSVCEKIAVMGDANFQEKLGKIYYQLKNVAEAIKWTELAAKQGLLSAQYHLALWVVTDDKTVKNSSNAIDFLKNAAEKDYLDAQVLLAQLYLKGEGVAQNAAQAVTWLEKAGKQGHLEAQWQLGEIYYIGQYVAQSYGRALEWIRRAAGQGHVAAQHRLGEMYAAGKGVNQNHKAAFAWFTLAAAAGYSDAVKWRDDSATYLTPEQIVEAKQQAKNIAAKYKRGNK